MKTNKIKYAIADDHEIFRHGVKLVLSDDPLLEFALEAGNGFALLKLLQTTPVDVILMDLRMPVMDGFSASKEIKAQFPQIKILVLTMHEEEQYVIHLMESGASGYLLKNARPDEIKKAIHCVHENDYYFNDLVSASLLKILVDKQYVTPKFTTTTALTEKELTVLQLICQEMTSVEIAQKVHLSARTVEGIRSGMIDKLGVKNIAGLVLYAAKNGIV
jgi:DNA-binding NarL/FixJ family response regulator